MPRARRPRPDAAPPSTTPSRSSERACRAEPAAEVARAHAPPTLGVGALLWLTADGRSLGGPGRMALLRAVAERGSITQAAKAFGMSYKAAWDAIDAMNRRAGAPLVERITGGRGGGATRLTARGRALLERHARIDALHRRFVERLDAAGADPDREFVETIATTMRTTARNQFAGRVEAVRVGAVNDEVDLALDAGHRLVATLPRDSRRELDLVPGRAALALVPAARVVLATDLGAARVSARNRLDGVVRSVSPGAVQADVALALDAGGAIGAIVDLASVAVLGLAVGTRASALVQASDVIVAVVG